jgi:peptidoglycan/LPS O-acetylase OafA/YrhL
VGWIPDFENNGVDYIIEENPFVWGTFDQDGFPFLANVHSIFFSSYIIGASILFIASLWWVFDAKRRKNTWRPISILEFYGTYSFSFYVYHSLFISLSFLNLQGILSPLLVLIVSIIILSIMGGWIHICVKHFHSIGTVEHIRKKMVEMLRDELGL